MYIMYEEVGLPDPLQNKILQSCLENCCLEKSKQRLKFIHICDFVSPTDD